MLRSLTWNHAILDSEPEADWVNAVDLIARNVRPLHRLTVTIDMCHQVDMLLFAEQSRRTVLVASDAVMLPVCKLQDLQDPFVHLSGGRNHARSFDFEGLTMGEGYHPTKGELEAKIEE